jgi:ferredoxin-NADP reductase
MLMVLTLKEKEHIADNVWAFRFKPSEPLSWTAGQYVRVELPHDNPDKEGTKRWFTDSAAPYQGILQITTRVTDSTFKQALSKLPEGDTSLQLLEKPHGDFVWQDSELPILFVAGGIGITPFYSILKQRAHEQLPLNATLIYGGRTADVPFREELDQWVASDPEFKVQYLIGTPLTAESLATLKPDINQSLVYLSGPEPMVETLGDQLKAHGLPEAQLKQDFFPNYTENNY